MPIGYPEISIIFITRMIRLVMHSSERFWSKITINAEIFQKLGRSKVTSFEKWSFLSKKALCWKL